MAQETTKISVKAQGATTASAHMDLSENRTSTNKKPYRAFGSDNLFPQAASHLARHSNAHRGIMNFKMIYSVGKGLDAGKNDTLKEFIKQVNGKGESMDQVLEKLIIDYLWTGNAYMEIVENKGTFSFFHKDTNSCRVSWEGANILIHSTWTGSIKKSDIKKIPLYPKFGKQTRVEKKEGAASAPGKRSIFHFKSYEPGFKWYGVPDWIAGFDAAAIAWKTNSWNVSRLDNDFRPSQIVIISSSGSDEEAIEMKDALIKDFSGHDKAGKMYFIIKEVGGEADSEVLNLNNETEGDWGGLHKQSENDLMMAHSWFRTLSSLPDNAGLANKGDIARVEYEMAQGTTIANIQRVFLPNIISIIQATQKIEAEGLSIIAKPPIGFTKGINLNNCFKVWEIRKALGEPFDETDPEQNIFVSHNGKNKNKKNGTSD